MAKSLKIAAIVIGLIIVVIVLFAVALTVFVDPNRYRDDIVHAVKAQTGRDLKIDGDLRLTLFPWLGLETKRLQLSNAAGFGAEPFAVVDGAETKVALLPLLQKKIVVKAVRLNGLKLHLARHANGVTNWDDLTAAPSAGSTKSPPPAAADTGAGAAFAVFTVERLELRHGEFTWRDQTDGSAYALRNVELKSGNLLGARAAPLNLAFDLESARPKLARHVSLDTALLLDLPAQTLEVTRLALRLGDDVQVNAKLNAGKILTAPIFSGTIDIPAFDPRPVLKEFGIAYHPADAAALAKLGLSTRFDADGRHATLSDMRLTLDGSTVQGRFAAQLSPAAYRFDVAIDAIDVDRYLPAASATGGKPAGPSANTQAAAIPIELLRGVDADGALRIGNLKAFGIRSQDVAIKVAARGGRVALGPNTAKLYGGAYAGRTDVDASSRVPRLQFAEKLSGVQLGPLLKDAGVFDRYTGTGNVDLRLTAEGRDPDQITRTLSGTVAVQLHDGKIQGVNLEKMVQQAAALIAQARGREVEAQAQAGDETAFKTLSASARVTNGVVHNDDLKLDGAVLRAQGSGSADLVKQTMDYRLQATVAQGAEHKGATVPIRIEGPFAALHYRVDVGALLKQQAKPVQEKVEKKIEKKLDDKLERLRNKLKR